MSAPITAEEIRAAIAPLPYAARLMMQSASRLILGTATASDRERVDVAAGDPTHPHHDAARQLLERLPSLAGQEHAA